MITNEDLANRFEYHPANTDERVRNHDQIRYQMKVLAQIVNRFCPEGREKSLAITKIEEAMFWANAAIARQKED